MSYTSVVIGANSFLGQEIIIKELLLKNNIIGVYNNNKNNLQQKIKYCSLSELYDLKIKIDVIYFVSAYVPDGDVNQEKLFNVNVKLLEDLIRFFSNAKIVLASSVSVYGNTKNVITEKTLTSPSSTYGTSKLWAEQILSLHQNYSIVRISSMYGKGMKTNTFLPRVIQSAINETRIILYGDGSRLQNYVHVSHVAEIMVKSAYIKENNICMAIGENSMSNREIAEILQKINSNILIKFVGTDNSPSFIYNDDETRKRLDVTLKVNLEDEIKNLWNWLKKF